MKILPMSSVDKQDINILDALQSDARLTNAQLSDRINMSASSCWRKVKSMEEEGVIQRYAAIVEPKKMGLNFEAIVHLHLDRHDAEGVEQLTKLLQECSEIVDCYATTGDFDYHLRVLCADIESYNLFLESTLFRHSTIRSMKTNVVLKRIKCSSPVKGVSNA